VIDKHFDILVSQGGAENKLQGPAYQLIRKPHMNIIIRAIIEGYNSHFSTRKKYRYGMYEAPGREYVAYENNCIKKLT